MNSKSCFSPFAKKMKTHARWAPAFATALVLLVGPGAHRAAAGGDAPAWMHALVNLPLPEHDEKTDAVLLYSEEGLTVQPNGKIKGFERRAYKILRQSGDDNGTVRAFFDSETKITGIHGWCIPAQGKDYEVKEKDTADVALGVANGELLSDSRVKVMRIPAAQPGNIIGYEIEHEDRPYVLQDTWLFQQEVPVREARYTLQLPPGWTYKAYWLNYPEAKPTDLGNGQWQWTVTNLKSIRAEEQMPPWKAVAGQMVVSLLPPGATKGNKGFETWDEMGTWYGNLAIGRQDASPELKKKIEELTKDAAPLAKMKSLAGYVQREIRYVAIELGIGGWQPHPAPEVFAHNYGDCKDKATLLKTALREAGIESYYVPIHTFRGSVAPGMPPVMTAFNHVILAIRIPAGVQDPSLAATVEHAQLGRLLFFDPTDTLTPFGQLRGELQGNYGLLVAPGKSELVELPKLPPSFNSIRRIAKLQLDSSGNLQGEIQEIRFGDRAAQQRAAWKGAERAADKIKPIETILAHSLANFQVTKASVSNATQTDQPFIYDYSIVSDFYGKRAGNLILVRPRVVGSKSEGILETKEPRRYAIEFEGPAQDTDSFEIALPAGYVVDDLPPPVNADFPFASYHSKSEVSGNVLRYTRTFEVKQLTVPLEKTGELKQFYRIIANDERSTAVLKPAGSN